jgi:hypothetical protein
VLIALPAAVAIWSGWVGLGELCGFGPVRLLPGITDLTVNTAITLPVGVEAYAAYALGAWMSPGTPSRARTFARWSALGALAYGMAGQIIYHLLAAAHATAAPWPVVVVVSCMPVAVLGLAAALTHLLRAPEGVAGEFLTSGLADSPATQPVSLPVSVPVSLPSLREIQRRRGCSLATAKKIRVELAAYERSRGGAVHGTEGTVPAAKTPPAGEPPQATPAPAGAHPTMNGHARG